MKVKTSDLQGNALDWAVAKCEGHDAVVDEDGEVATFKTIMGNEYKLLWKASTNWAQGGPIIEREKITIRKATYGSDGFDGWVASCLVSFLICCNESGPTPLVAAMRCYVASKLGEEVEVPGGFFEKGE